VEAKAHVPSHYASSILSILALLFRDGLYECASVYVVSFASEIIGTGAMSRWLVGGMMLRGLVAPRSNGAGASPGWSVSGVSPARLCLIRMSAADIGGGGQGAVV
jgi:hypothetical protein